MRQLDGVRAIAVLLVLAAHFGFLPGYGFLGVRIFFVLSGFLVTSILLEGGSLRSFYVRRALRIFPAFYLVVLVAALSGDGRILNNWPYVVTYTGNINELMGGGLGPGHFWSLYVEEQFYLVWPFALMLFPRNKYAITLAAIMTLSIAFRATMWQAGFEKESQHLPLGCLDTLGAGALLAFARRSGKTIPLLWAGPIVFAVVWYWPPLRGGWYAYADTAAAWAALWLVSGAAVGFKGVIGWTLANPVMCYIGRISYGIYLVHLFFVRRPTAQGLAMTFVLAILMYHVWETPWNRLKSRFPYSGRYRGPVPEALPAEGS